MARTDAATRGRMTRTAHRAVDDPEKLARAARVVRAAIALGKLDPDRDLEPLSAPNEPA